MNIIGVTKCPSGLAHTYIAAKQLEKLCKKAGFNCKVETQGASGIENELTKEDVEQADYVFVIADIPIANEERFKQKKVVKTQIKAFLNNGKVMLEEPEEYCTKPEKTEEEKTKEQDNDVQKHLMNGLNYLIPILVVSGTVFGVITHVTHILTPEITQWMELIISLCGIIAVPILSGFIANSISGKVAMVPAMIGTLLFAQQGNATIFGIIAGLLSGYIVLYASKVKLMRELTQPIFLVIIPVLLTIGLCAVVQLVPGLQTASQFCIDMLKDYLATPYAGLLGFIIGGLVTYDFGGRLNKIAYMVGVLSLTLGMPELMSAVAIAICIPPLSLFVHKLIKKEMDKEVFKQTFVLGLFGITEGVIEHVAEKPVLKQSMIIGTMIASGVSIVLQLQVWVPHGGIMNAVFLSVNDIFLYLFTIFTGILVVNLAIWVLNNKMKTKEVK